MANGCKSPLVLVILDGFGYSKKTKGNAIMHANMPMWKKLIAFYPTYLLEAAGKFVGLLPGEQGNSEVGHLTLGAGRVTPSPQLLLHDLIRENKLHTSIILNDAFSLLKKNDAALHIISLVSDGGVHALQEFLYAVLQEASIAGLKRVFIHAILDGRDVLPQSAKKYLADLEQWISKFKCGKIVSIQGRFYAMDRDNNWDRTNASYSMMTKINVQEHINSLWQNKIDASYEQGIYDEFVVPTLLNDSGIIHDSDGIIMTNTRPDRAKQLASCFLGLRENLKPPKISFFITPTVYDISFLSKNNAVLFKNLVVNETLLDVLNKNNKQVVIVAETEKKAHVTYFFKGMRDVCFANELRILIRSHKQATYVNNVAMAAEEITAQVKKKLIENIADFYLVNYANADMVGHSGDFLATIQACEVLDKQLEELYQEVVVTRNGILCIVADHGNAEKKEAFGQMHVTAHTNNPVLFVCSSNSSRLAMPEKMHIPLRGLAAVAPTIIRLLGLPVPEVMERPLW